MIRSVALLSLGCVGCGLLPARRDNASPPPDGIAVYDDLGPIELCQSGTRLVPSGPPVSGFCVDGGEDAGASCSTDEGCASRERCLCGRCVVPFCDQATDCRAGQTCIVGSSRCGASCAVDLDCPAGDLCDRGLCAAACRGDGACQHGEVCSALRGVCIASACESGSDCAPGERCDAQLERRDLREPAVLARAGTMLLFVEDRAARQILRGTGTTPDRFEVEPEPVLVDAAGPAPIERDGHVGLFYAAADGSAILVAVEEGAGFDEDGVVLAPEEPWEGTFVGSPGVTILEGRIVVAYLSAGGIGLALEGTDGSFEKQAGPVVQASDLEDPLLWRSIDRLSAPALLADRTALGEPRLRMWISARGAEGATTVLGDELAAPPLNDSVGYLESLDGGATFDPSPYNPTFARVAELGHYKAESDPWVVPRQGGYLLYFVGASVDDGLAEGVGLASNE